MEFFKEFFEELKLIFKSSYKYLRFFIIILLFFLSSLFKQIPISLFNIDINNMSDATNALLTLFSNSMTVILCILLFFNELKRDFIKLKKTKKNKLVIMLDHSFRYWVIGLIVMVVSNFIIEKLGIAMASNDASVRNMLEASPFATGISIVFLTPFIEEMTFRMAFKDIFKKKWLFILLSGIIFGSLHVVFSLANIYELLYLIPYCSLGIAFAYIYYESDNIYISFGMHLLHNLLTAFTSFLLAGVLLW